MDPNERPKQDPRSPAAQPGAAAAPSAHDERAEAPPQGEDVLSIITDVERQLERIRGAQRDHDAQMKEIERRAAEVTAAHAKLSDTAAALKQFEHNLHQRQQALAQQTQEWQQQRQQEQQQLASERAALESASVQAEHAKSAEDARLRAELEKAQADTEQALAGQQRLAAELEAARGDAERSRAELAEATKVSRESDSEAQRIASEREAAARSLEALQHELTGAQQELAQARQERAAAQTDLAAAQRDLHSLGAQVKQLSAAAADRAAQIEKLEAALAAAGGNEQRNGELEQQLASAREQARRAAVLEQQLAAASASQAELEQRAAEKQRVIEELETALSEAKATAGARSSVDESEKKDLREKARALKTAAAHLQRRRTRLQALRHALRKVRTRAADLAAAEAAAAKQSAAARSETEARSRQLAQIDHQREELRQVRAMLERTEAEMVRKWARARALQLAMALMLYSAVVAVASWFGADHFFPATIAASATFEPAPRAGQSLSEDETAKWQQWHAGLVNDGSFQSAVAKRMESRRVDQYSEASAVAARIASELKVDTAKPGQVTLTLAGTDRTETTQFLDTVAATLVAESAKQVGKRSDGARAAAVNERKDGGTVRYSTVNPVPLIDQRMRYAGIIFGAALVLSLALAGVIYGRLLRSKRLFEQETNLGSLDEDGGAKVAIR